LSNQLVCQIFSVRKLPRANTRKAVMKAEIRLRVYQLPSILNLTLMSISYAGTCVPHGAHTGGRGRGRGREGTASSPTSRPGRKAEEAVWRVAHKQVNSLIDKIEMLQPERNAYIQFGMVL
jgi:hypothetical protein